MNSGESLRNKQIRIVNRMFILSHLDDIIKESIYYRSHSGSIVEEKIATIDINCEEGKAKILWEYQMMILNICLLGSM